jgi:glycosyltransferase involved in cell wall biosynthesis
MKPQVSIVIPTCNRKESLLKTLKAASLQLYPAEEIIVVDASAQPIGAEEILRQFPTISLRYFTCRPSVCVQRNMGIKMATHPYILLCDDDVEMPEDYLLKLTTYLSEHEEAGIVTGLFLQKNNDAEWEYQYKTTSLLKCLWNFIFQLSCWGDFTLIKTNFLTAPFLNAIKKWYAKRGNTYSNAGWPLLTHFTNPVTRTNVYTLGAALIKKEWLLASPFEEKLLPNGIGDNYGVTLNLPEVQPVHLLTEAFVWHHHAPENRMKMVTAYRYRIYALHYFMKKSDRFNYLNILWLYWSLIGNFIWQTGTLKFNLAFTSAYTLLLMGIGKNPYLRRQSD